MGKSTVLADPVDEQTAAVFDGQLEALAKDEPEAFTDAGYEDTEITVWDSLDIEELVRFMPDQLDLSDVPTVAERQKQAKMAVQKRANDLLGHDIVWVAWRPQEALLVAEGTITEGYFAVGKDLTTNENISLFIGGVALCRVLGRVKAPMRARLEKRGRTLVFA